MKIRTELSLLALALELLLAAITSGDVHASTPSDPAPIVQGYQRLPRDPAQPPAKAGKALTLGVNLHPGQVVRICPGTSQSPTPAAVGNPRALLAPHPGLIELDGVSGDTVNCPPSDTRN